VNQNLSTLTGDGYAAGSYWHSVWGSSAPALSVLGNSTRAYSHLHQISADIKQAMLPRYRGYYNRDVMNGILPEAEDCQEALAFSLDVRDLYQPPEGSGLVQNEEGFIFMNPRKVRFVVSSVVSAMSIHHESARFSRYPSK
jgi:hypothetical protein